MKVYALNCSECGASLDVSGKARFITCGFCGTQLAVKHEGNAHYTEALEDLQRTTAKLADKVDQLQQHSAVEALDRQWEGQQRELLNVGEHGQLSVPTKAGAIAVGVLASGFGAFWMIMAFSMGSFAGSMGAGSVGSVFRIFPFFGLIFIGAGLVGAVSQYRKAEQYLAAKRNYEAERRRLTR